MLEKLKFWQKEVKKDPFEEELENALHELSSYPPDDDRHWKAMESLERLAKVKKDLVADGDVEASEKGFKYICKRVFETVTDPKVIACAISSVVYVWWGNRCMYYDREGNIPPNRMLSNGPKPPKT